MTLEMLQWKATNGVTNKGFEELLGIVKNMLLEGNELPSTTFVQAWGDDWVSILCYQKF